MGSASGQSRETARHVVELMKRTAPGKIGAPDPFVLSAAGARGRATYVAVCVAEDDCEADADGVSVAVTVALGEHTVLIAHRATAG